MNKTRCDICGNETHDLYNCACGKVFCRKCSLVISEEYKLSVCKACANEADTQAVVRKYTKIWEKNRKRFAQDVARVARGRSMK